jgi:hypothetical protein
MRSVHGPNFFNLAAAAATFVLVAAISAAAFIGHEQAVQSREAARSTPHRMASLAQIQAVLRRAPVEADR